MNKTNTVRITEAPNNKWYRDFIGTEFKIYSYDLNETHCQLIKNEYLKYKKILGTKDTCVGLAISKKHCELIE